MLKALLKKQFLELGYFYFRNRKAGKSRTKGGTTLYALLFLLVFCILGGVFYTVAAALAGAMIPGTTWLYFALMGILSLILGVFGSVFSTYAALYHAKDNELLLSMPIPPSKILFVRMTGVYAMGLLYEAVVMIPAVIAYCLTGHPSAVSVLFSVLLIFILGFLILTLSCLLGWVVALISARLKNKSFITVLFSLAFLGVYFYFCSNMYSVLGAIVEHSAELGVTIRNAAYPLYLLGRACEGDPLSMLIFTLLAALVFALTCFILSKTFLRIATRRESGAKAVYREKKSRAGSPELALFKKEWRRFTSSATYMLNCALGTVFMPVIGVLALIYSGEVREMVQMLFGGASDFLVVLAVAAVCACAAMNDLTAPSVSLEGKSIWVVQSMPVPAAKVLDAKQHLHWALTLPPALFLVICLAVVLGVDLLTGVLMAVFAGAFVLLSSALGLAINLKKPNLTWTNETAPVKQSLGVMICLFGGWLFSAALGVAGYFATLHIRAALFLGLCILVTALLTLLLNRWIKTGGARIFERL